MVRIIDIPICKDFIFSLLMYHMTISLGSMHKVIKKKIDLNQLFPGLNQLEDLDISNNLFHSFPSAALRRLSNLKSLNISGNLFDVSNICQH